MIPDGKQPLRFTARLLCPTCSWSMSKQMSWCNDTEASEHGPSELLLEMTKSLMGYPAPTMPGLGIGPPSAGLPFTETTLQTVNALDQG